MGRAAALTSGSSSAPAIASRREQSKKVQERGRSIVTKPAARATPVLPVLSLGSSGIRLSDCSKLILDHEICDCSFCESKFTSLLEWFSLTPAPPSFIDLRADSVGSLREAITSVDEEPEVPSAGFRSISNGLDRDAFVSIYSRIDPLDDFETYDTFRPSCVPWEAEIDLEL